MSNIRIAYINLSSRPGRRDAFLRNNRSELDASAFPWRRVAGIDGRGLSNSTTTEELTARGIIARDGLPEGYEPHTSGHLGAALSHRSLWEEAARSADDDVLVILEDDAELCPQFGARLRRVLESAKNREPWDILHLGFNTDASVTIQLNCPQMDIQLICQENGRPIGLGAPFVVSWPETPYEGETLLARVIDIHGICGYAVSARGARRLLEACFPMTATSIDGTITRKTREGLLQALIAIPPLVLSANDHADSDTVCSALVTQ
ncbi:MAG TPA: glycosyltransferase family 25 protein [Thermoanaerobaculia bacterium]|nr:glycosyltransferase family 25 protein [Thermoanaerobaculia bacterium]